MSHFYESWKKVDLYAARHSCSTQTCCSMRLLKLSTRDPDSSPSLLSLVRPGKLPLPGRREQHMIYRVFLHYFNPPSSRPSPSPPPSHRYGACKPRPVDEPQNLNCIRCFLDVTERNLSCRDGEGRSGYSFSLISQNKTDLRR